MGHMLRACEWRVLKFIKGLKYLARHRNINILLVIVLINGDTAVVPSGTVNEDVI